MIPLVGTRCFSKKYGIIGDELVGKYTSYYENGKIEAEGQHYDGEWTSIRTGEWKWYKLDGTIESTENYKAEVIKWPNGNLQSVGGYLLNEETKEWIKIGEWRWCDEDGSFESSKKYDMGIETND